MTRLKAAYVLVDAATATLEASRRDAHRDANARIREDERSMGRAWEEYRAALSELFQPRTDEVES